TEGVTIAAAPGGHFARLVTFLPGTPLAEARGTQQGRSGDGGGTEEGRRRDGGGTEEGRSRNLGRAIGELDAALADFDHPAVHREFHWDLAQAPRVIHEHLPRIADRTDRDLVARVSERALAAVQARQSAFRRSVIHNDANDWNVLVDGDRIAGLIDFG